MILSFNKYAKFKYSISEEFEAGLVLNGLQVKAIKAKTFNIRDSIVRFKKDELWLMNLYFTDPSIPKDIKLLLNQREVDKLSQIVNQKTAYIFPLNIHLKGNLIKMSLGVGKHKNQYDKREAIKKADDLREIEREMKSR
jgi:SsrA-binding protein